MEQQASTESYSINLVTGRGYNGGYNGGCNNNMRAGGGYNNSNGFRGGYNNNNYRGLSNRGGRNRGRGRMMNNNNKPQCQLCGKVGHVVLNCYYRFDQGFQGGNQNFQGGNIGFQGGANQGNFQGSGSSQNTGNQQYSAFMASQNADAPYSAFMASPDTFFDPSWVAYLGATNHCTPTSENLHYQSAYKGKDQVLVGNGSGIPISSIGKTTFSTNSHSFYLKDILHTPSITKNFFSVSKFTKDNNCYFEFFSDACFVKDQVTRRVLLQGSLRNGLYAFHLSLQATLDNFCAISLNSCHVPCDSIKFAYTSLVSNNSGSVISCISNKHSLDLWHKRLGHPAFTTVKLVLNKCKLSFFDSYTFCVDCSLGKSHKLPFHASHTTYSAPLQLI